MPGTLRRLVRRGLLLAAGAAAAWLIGTLLANLPARAGAAIVPLGLTSSTAPTTPSDPPPHPASPLISTVKPTVSALESALDGRGLTSSLTAPIFGPVESLLGGAPIDGVLSPSPVPIQGTPIASIATGVLSVVSSVPSVAEPTGAAPAAQFQQAGPDSAARTTGTLLPGSVPDPNSPSGPSGPIDPSGLTPLGVVPLPAPAPPLLPVGAETGSGAGTEVQTRTGTDSDVPPSGIARSLVASRAPPRTNPAIARLIADEPSFSPD